MQRFIYYTLKPIEADKSVSMGFVAKILEDYQILVIAFVDSVG
jgi:hypothetical protein